MVEAAAVVVLAEVLVEPVLAVASLVGSMVSKQVVLVEL